MQKVAIVVDSISCLTKELVEQYKIRIVPIMLLVQGRVYRDMIDITPSQAYELFITEFTPVMGYATGTGTLGFAFYSDD